MSIMVHSLLLLLLLLLLLIDIEVRSFDIAEI